MRSIFGKTDVEYDGPAPLPVVEFPGPLSDLTGMKPAEWFDEPPEWGVTKPRDFEYDLYRPLKFGLAAVLLVELL